MVSANGADNFRVDRKVALLFGCSKYDELRKIAGMERFSDLPEVLDDIANVTDGLKRLDFSDDEIHTLLEPTFDQCRTTVLEQSLAAEKDKNLNTLFFVYYAGHGCMKLTTRAVLNGERDFPLEDQVRAMSAS